MALGKSDDLSGSEGFVLYCRVRWRIVSGVDFNVLPEAQQVKALSIKADDLDLTPGTHMVEREKQVVLWPTYVLWHVPDPPLTNLKMKKTITHRFQSL